MPPSISSLILSLTLAFANVATAALPEVDFDRMGKVGLAGAFAGLDLFTDATVSFDPTTSTLLSRAADGSLARVASTDTGGSILAGCVLSDVFYVAGNFSTINGVSAPNIAAYTPSSGVFAAVGTGGPNAKVNAVFCDAQGNKLWVGGSFTSPGNAIAIFDPKAGSWTPAPFGGVSGAQAEVASITTNSSDASLFFAGSFLTEFGTANVILNGSHNANVPLSAGASPFSSSLVPIPLQDANVSAPSSASAGFNDINNILCPAEPDGSGNTWFASDNTTPLIAVLTQSSIVASGVRLGNTFLPNHGTTAFSVTTIPDNTVRPLKFLDPTTGQNVTCTDPCPLSTDSSLLYQDFLFDGPLSITGVQIKLSAFTGVGAGLHILQVLSAGAFASAIASNNVESCFALAASNNTQTGTWNPVVANTDIAGTVQTVLVSDFAVGTPSSTAPTFTWFPFVSAAGNYNINILIPGCTNLQDCAKRTSVKVTVFPGPGLSPTITTVSQQNKNDVSQNIFSGVISASTSNFATTITMSLADNPDGTGQNGQYELVADRVELVLTSVNATSDGNTTTPSGGAGQASGFGFLEWPRTSTAVDSSIDGTKFFPNSTLTALDTLGFDTLSALGGSAGLDAATTTINAVAHHSSGAILIGGAFVFSSGTASGSANIVAFKNGALAPVSGSGLNGPVSSLVINGDQLFVGGAFTDTKAATAGGKLGGIAIYDIVKDSWTPVVAGVNGDVTSIGMINNQVQVAGNFTEVLPASGSGDGSTAAGFATWDLKTDAWVNSGGFVVGQLTFVGNGTNSQYIAGQVTAARKVGASGLVMLSNGNADGPAITSLAVDLDGVGTSASGSAAQSPAAARRTVVEAHRRSSAAWMSHTAFSSMFKRQAPASSSLAPLPASLSASSPAVLAGAFWTNSSSSKQITIFGGNFSFIATGASGVSEGVALYEPESATLTALNGPQVNGTVRALLVDGNSLYVGGEFTIAGASVNGLALYDLAAGAWDLNGLQALQPAAGATVVVRSISKSTAKPTLLVVAGSFAQAGSLRCQAICSFDTSSKQWNALGSGILGEVAGVVYAGDNQNILYAGGSIALSDNTASNVAQFSIDNQTWVAVGSGSDIPGPVSALEVNNGNATSLFAAGQSTDGSSSFLTFWDGIKWATLGSSFAEGTTVAQLTMVPLQSTHSANSIIQSDRILMISGALATSSGNASSALFDGETLTPYIVTTSATGTLGSVSSLFHSFTSFSFNQRKFLATGVVILISIAIAAGIVFLLALIGILWTLFSRKDDKLHTFAAGDDDDDDDSAHHRPSSLLEHINAATRTTILGTAAGSAFGSDKEEERSPEHQQDPFGPDASNYIRAETPSDAVGGMLAEETSRPARARYSFDGTGEGELPISTGAEVEVLDDRDPAWWYARDVRTGREGVVPAAYLY